MSCCCQVSCPQTVTTYEDKEVECCVPVMVKEMRTCKQQVCNQVEEMKDVVCCVPVMTKEKRVGKRMICEPITETKEIEVCVPHTTCETKCVSSCNGCCQTVSCPTTTYTTEKKTITCTRMESKCVDYDYEVSICKMEQQTKQVKVCRWVTECVEKQYEVSVCKMEKVKKTIKVAVCTTVCGGCHNTCC